MGQREAGTQSKREEDRSSGWLNSRRSRNTNQRTRECHHTLPGSIVSTGRLKNNHTDGNVLDGGVRPPDRTIGRAGLVGSKEALERKATVAAMNI